MSKNVSRTQMKCLCRLIFNFFHDKTNVLCNDDQTVQYLRLHSGGSIRAKT